MLHKCRNVFLPKIGNDSVLVLGSGEVPNNSHALVNLKWSQVKLRQEHSLSYLAKSVRHSTVVGSTQLSS